MIGPLILLAEICAYLLLARWVVRRWQGPPRQVAFALLNIAGLYVFFFTGQDSRLLPTFAAYLVWIILQYAALRLFAQRDGRKAWIAFLVPLLALVFVRYVPPSLYSRDHLPYGPFFIGISYLAFRASHLVIEVRNGIVPTPTFLEYLGFCFFVPTISVGPINAYSNHRLGFDPASPSAPIGRTLFRMLVGFVKFKFLGSICFQLSYANLLFDDHFHSWIDLLVAALFYYLFLYCNFSGFCDIAIGGAAFMGIPVAENFANPFGARNVREFWNRWHITLSQYMRDVVFAPLSKFLVRLLGPANLNHAIAITILIVFLLIGVWHGVGWNFAAFGAVHAAGVVTNHYYTLGLKKWLGREGFKAYNENRLIQAAAVGLTFCYCAASLFFFANTIPEMKRIFSVLS